MLSLENQDLMPQRNVLSRKAPLRLEDRCNDKKQDLEILSHPAPAYPRSIWVSRRMRYLEGTRQIAGNIEGDIANSIL